MPNGMNAKGQYDVKKCFQLPPPAFIPPIFHIHKPQPGNEAGAAMPFSIAVYGI